MEFKVAERIDIRIKMALAGKSGSGKTLGALLIAKGLVSDPSKIGVIQTEPGRAQCYLKQVGPFKVLELQPPFTPGRFVEAIDKAISGGIKCLVVDSVSDEWSGIGGSLDMHSEASKTSKNSFTAWSKVTPAHDSFFNKIMSAPIHIIGSVKKKTDVVLEEQVNKQGRKVQVPKKVGMKDIQREDSEYKWMLQFDLDENNLATTSKDNTSLFTGREPFKINEDTGKEIRQWCLDK